MLRVRLDHASLANAVHQHLRHAQPMLHGAAELEKSDEIRRHLSHVRVQKTHLSREPDYIHLRGK